MFRKALIVVVVFTLMLALAAPMAAAPARQDSSFGSFFWSLVERFSPSFGADLQKNDKGPAIDPNTPNGLVVPQREPAIDPDLQNGSESSDSDSDSDKGSSMDPHGGS